MSKKLAIDSAKHCFLIGEHVASLAAAAAADTPIRESEWLSINVHDLPSHRYASELGEQLRTALDVASASTRLGVDTGHDKITSSFSQAVVDHVHLETGAKLRGNVHGLDVFEDDPAVVIFDIKGTATVHANPEPFLALISEIHGKTHVLSERSCNVLLLLNFALMRPEPVAQIVFAFSAVEALGQSESWSPAQATLLTRLAAVASSSSDIDPAERQEVSEAIVKSLHRLSLRQGVMRLLDALELQHLKRSWDSLYGERSSLVHGLAPRPGADYSDLAHRAVTLCGHILLRYVARELPEAARHAAVYFPLEPRNVSVAFTPATAGPEPAK